MSEQTPRDPSDSKPDSLIGVRDCGCITAWMSLEWSAGEKEINEFYADMAGTGREVRRVRLEDIRDKIGRCEHGGITEAASEIVQESFR